MARHLVLGAAGFLGRHLTRSLVSIGEEVTPAGRGVDGRTGGDLSHASEADLARLIADHAVVYHLAWSTVPHTSEADPEADLGGNVALFVRVLRAARDSGARIVFTSSGGTVYGRGGGPAPFRETDPLQPIGVHGAGKAAAELYAHAFREAHDVDVRIARLSNPFGAGQAGSKLQGAASRFAVQALKGECIEIWGDGSTVRDYLHVSDAIAGLVSLGAAKRQALGPDPVFNIGSGIGTSLVSLVDQLGAALGRRIEVRHLSGRPFDVPVNVLDISRVDQRLGWRPSLSLDQGLARMVADLGAEPATMHAIPDGSRRD